MIFKTKAEARRYFADLRSALAPETKANKDGAIIRRIRDLAEYRRAELVLCYYPIKGEIDLRPLMEQAMAEGKRVALPTLRDGVMTFREYTGELTRGTFGIPEPTGEQVAPDALTLCILPGYGYDGAYRLGYGGGYYDRFLQDFRGVSLGAFYRAFTAEFPHEEHDKTCDIMIHED